MKFILFIGLAWFIFFRKPGSRYKNVGMRKGFESRFEAENFLYDQDGFSSKDVKHRSSNGTETNITYNDGYEAKITKNKDHKSSDW